MKRFPLLVVLALLALVVSSCAVGVRGTGTGFRGNAVATGKALSTTGGPGSYYIEYGEPGGANQQTPTRSVDFVEGSLVPVREEIEGLDPGTTYRYAVCAEDSENPGDPFCSPDQTFTTLYEPVLTVERNCTGGNGIDVTLTGMPPDTDFVGRIRFPAGNVSGPATFTTDAEGTFTTEVHQAGDGTWTVQTEWTGLELERSIYVDCDLPPSFSDSAVGTGQEGSGDAPTFAYTVDAHSGPSGEGPGGTLHWRYQRGNQGEVNATISCLAVDGDTAVIGFTGLFGGVFNGKMSISGRARITENDGADDTFEYLYNATGPSVDYFDPDPPPIAGPTDCSVFPGTGGGTDPRDIDVGGAVVTDTVPSSPSRR